MESTILSNLLTGIICLYIGFRLHVGGDAAERRRLFRAQIDVFLAKVRDTHEGLIDEFHSDTLTTIRDECAKISSDVWWFRRRRFDEAAQQYYCYQGEIAPAPRKIGGQRVATILISGEPKKDCAKRLLAKIRDYAR